MARDDYEEIWQMLAAMPKLRELRVKLSMNHVSNPEHMQFNEQVWLAPLKKFEGLKVFDLDLSNMRWSKISSDVDVGQCQIRLVGVGHAPYVVSGQIAGIGRSCFSTHLVTTSMSNTEV